MCGSSYFVCFVSWRPRHRLGYLAGRSYDWYLEISRAATQRQSGEIMTSVSACHIVPTQTQTVGCGTWSKDRTHDLLNRSRLLYRLSFHTPAAPDSSVNRALGIWSLNAWIVFKLVLGWNFDTIGTETNFFKRLPLKPGLGLFEWSSVQLPSCLCLGLRPKLSLGQWISLPTEISPPPPPPPKSQ